MVLTQIMLDARHHGLYLIAHRLEGMFRCEPVADTSLTWQGRRRATGGEAVNAASAMRWAWRECYYAPNHMLHC